MSMDVEKARAGKAQEINSFRGSDKNLTINLEKPEVGERYVVLRWVYSDKILNYSIFGVVNY